MLTRTLSLGFTIVLQIDNMLIVDIDNQQDDKIIKNIENFYKKYNLNCLIYKTKNGHRVFITNKKFDITSDYDLIFHYYQILEGDIQYLQVSLTGKENFFHARIVPKYKKFRNKNEEKILKNFLKYQKDDSIAVTRYITSIGDGLILDDFKNFIAKHDKATKAFLKDSILV